MRQRTVGRAWAAAVWMLLAPAAVAGDRAACEVVTPKDAGALFGGGAPAPAVSSPQGCAYHDQASGLALTLVLHGPLDEPGFDELRRAVRGALRDEPDLGVPAFSETTSREFSVSALKSGRAISLTVGGKPISAEVAAKLRALTKTALRRL